MTDKAFNPTREELIAGVSYVLEKLGTADHFEVDQCMPQQGIGERETMALLAPMVIGGATHLGDDLALAHMDPPTPWITWISTFWNAALNQNLLHPDVSPVARQAEECVLQWLAPYFGMQGGHMTPGSTVSNLTALWAAREIEKVKRVVASEDAHLSIKKAANLLGLELLLLGSDTGGKLDVNQLPDTLDESVLVLTAGTTSAGAIDPLSLCGDAAWTHIDAAWAGPLVFSDVHAHKLECIGMADSVAVSAHKWLFQPKESALIMFKNNDAASAALSFGGQYLSAPNIGLLGSHGANAVPLLATLLAWGCDGLAYRLDSMMQLAESVKRVLREHSALIVSEASDTGVILWRPADSTQMDALLEALPTGLASTTHFKGHRWCRQVCANPNASDTAIVSAIDKALLGLQDQ